MVNPRYLIDIGAGVGTFSIAANYHWIGRPTTAIDRSCSQIYLGRRLTALSKRKLDFVWIKGNAESTCRDIEGTRLISYFLCENEFLFGGESTALDLGGENTALDQILGKEALVIDYPEILEKLKLYSDLNGFSFYVPPTMEINLGKSLSRLIGQETIKLSGGYFVKNH
jgi:hypothetical protein